MKLTCETCAHRDGALCRRFPPGAAVGAAALWPTVTSTDWCGEHSSAGVDIALAPTPKARKARK